MHKNDGLAIRNCMRQYTGEDGLPAFRNLLALPARIPHLVKGYGDQQVHALISALIGAFANSFNVVRQMTAAQITACAFDLMESAKEDWLAMEDLVLFFDLARKGKYGKVYDRLDQQTIFEMLELYREERHQDLVRSREERDANFRGLGPSERMPVDTLQLSLDSIGGRIGDIKNKMQ